MKCYSVIEEKVVLGIGVNNLPFTQIEIPKNGKHAYIPVESSLVSEWKEVCRIGNIIAQKGRVYDAFPVPIRRSHGNGYNYYKLAPVPTNAKNDKGVIVYWELTGGYNGQACIKEGIYSALQGKILILGRKYHFEERKKVAETAICVCTLAEGQYIEGGITGHKLYPRKMLLNNGKHIVVSSVY